VAPRGNSCKVSGGRFSALGIGLPSAQGSPKGIDIIRIIVFYFNDAFDADLAIKPAEHEVTLARLARAVV
jgi:hypothetical protein